MKTILISCFALFLSLNVFAQSSDAKSEARAELTQMMETLVKADPALELTMKEENSLLRLMVAQKLHLKNLDTPGAEKAAAPAERAELVKGYEARIQAVLGAERVEALKVAAAALEVADPPAEK